MTRTCNDNIETVMAPVFGRALKAIATKRVPAAVRATTPLEVDTKHMPTALCYAKAVSAS